MTSAVTIELESAPTDEARMLVAELDAALSAEYPPEQRHGLSVDTIFQPNIRFFLAYMNGSAVGCAGVALFADFAEVKRMYVRPPARGSGAARALLDRLEHEARNRGLEVLRLETGVRQAAALKFYQRAGFRPCSAFGDYRAMDRAAITASVFLEKRLGADERAS